MARAALSAIALLIEGEGPRTATMVGWEARVPSGRMLISMSASIWSASIPLYGKLKQRFTAATKAPFQVATIVLEFPVWVNASDPAWSPLLFRLSGAFGP